jgi:hypothetical protein
MNFVMLFIKIVTAIIEKNKPETKLYLAVK